MISRLVSSVPIKTPLGAGLTLLFVQVLLKPYEYIADLVRPA